MKSLKEFNLEKLAKKYEVQEFILTDPIQFPHRFKKQEDIEIAAFVSSLFAYGNRKIFIKKLDSGKQLRPGYSGHQNARHDRTGFARAHPRDEK